MPQIIAAATVYYPRSFLKFILLGFLLVSFPLLYALGELIVSLGGAMIEAGESVEGIQDTLDRVAAAYGAQQFEHFVLPTGLFVQSTEAGAPGMVLRRHSPTTAPRFDQVAALYRLIRRAERGEVTPGEGLAELDQIRRLQPQFGRIARVAIEVRAVTPQNEHQIRDGAQDGGVAGLRRAKRVLGALLIGTGLCVAVT